MDSSTVRTVNLSAAYEARTLEALTKPFILPVTIVTGFLGAGKTTLMQSLLRKKRNLRIATLVNDFGSVNYDGELLERTTEPSRLYQVHDGCMCCTAHLTERVKEDVWEMLQTPDDASNKAVDYLVIETSGVTEPSRIIALLDQRFGKMTRARLDSVVTLVDADAMLHDYVAGGGEGGGGGVEALPTSMRSQLQYADVVVLNKIDLLTTPQGVDGVESLIRAVNPHARLHRATYGDVPLPLVLDVELPHPTDTNGGGGGAALTHEASRADYVATGSKKHRSDASKPAPPILTGKSPPAKGGDGDKEGHLVADGLSSLTFDSTRPFLLSHLQAFLTTSLPPGVVRLKGAIHVAEAAGCRWRLSMSGRRRFSVEDDGPWTSVPRTQLVFIGKDLDKQALTKALEAACITCEEGEEDEHSSDGGLATGGESRPVAPQEEMMREVVSSDARVEVVEGERWGEAGGVVAFRLAAGVARELGVSEEHLGVKHGVDVGGMDEELMRRVNLRAAEGGGRLLWPLRRTQEGAMVLGVMGDGQQGAERFWREVVAVEAQAVVKDMMAHVTLCKCGH